MTSSSDTAFPEFIGSAGGTSPTGGTPSPGAGDAVPLPSILIVDDDPGMIQALAKTLQGLGRLRFATRGADALRLMQESPPDLVLLDAQMPGLSGFEVLDAMRLDALLVDLPVIMITSCTEEEIEQAGLEKGAADFIAKPLRPAIVQARVRTQLRLKVANDELRQMSAEDRRKLAKAMNDLRASHARLKQTADDLALANEGLLQFVRMASHDMREPLNTMVQFTGLVVEDHAPVFPEDAQRYLQLVLKAGHRMRTLLDDVVRYARLQQAGEAEPHAPVALDTILNDLRDALAARLQNSGGTLHIEPLPQVMGHASLLSLLFQNLLANALKFVPAGRTPEVRVSVKKDDHMARVTVSDNGIGIAPEHLSKLFQPFQRLHLRKDFEGTGLGLSICRQIAELHGGSIDVHASPEGGSSFSVTLPLVWKDSPPAPPSVPSPGGKG
ncbi:MAG TPA: hybrid sensor histidine kinase/response regulator [Hydrogenophaga sp.]|nr:hybrid sensor histidine kinase/response regulator [Hydrogenophaga sp.]